MRKTICLGAFVAVVIAAGLGNLTHAIAQTYPDRVVKIIVPAGPGGPTDVLARLIADRLSASFGQSVIVENRGGGGGAVGAKAVANADPDGYTLLFGNTATLANITAVSSSAGYDPVKNFTAVAKVMDSYQMLAVKTDFPAKTAREFIAYAKAHPGKLNYGAVGLGNLTNLSGELLKLKAGIDFVSVQFKSGSESLAAVAGDQVQFGIDNVTAVRPLVDGGTLRVLAVTSAERQKDYPDLPTMMESGVPDYVVTSFFGVVAPAGTPAPIVTKLNTAINQALQSDGLKSILQKLGAQVVTASSEQFGVQIATESKKWKEIAAAAKIKID